MVNLLQLGKMTTYQSGGSAPSNMSHQQVEEELQEMFGSQEVVEEKRVAPKKRTSKNKK